MALFGNLVFHQVIASSDWWDGAYSTSYANRADGGIIAIYKQNTIYGQTNPCLWENSVADYKTLMTNNCMSIANRQEALLIPGNNSVGRVFNVGAELYMIVSSEPTTNTGVWGTYIYYSPSGNGGDWELYSTLQTNSLSDMSWGPVLTLPSPVTILDDGRWVVLAPYYDWHWYFGTKDIDNLVYAWWSDDNGQSWESTPLLIGGNRFDGHVTTRPTVYGGVMIILSENNLNQMHLFHGSADGDSWEYISTDGFPTYGTLFAGFDGLLYGTKHYTGTAGHGFYSRDSVPEYMPPHDWTFVSDPAGLSHTPDFVYLSGNLTYTTGANVSHSGISLQTMSRLVWVVPDPNGSMLYDGNRYRFVKTIAESEVTTHATAGEESTYTYAGPTLTTDGTLLQFLASGITDPSAPGGYGSYTNDTSRTVLSMADRENFVNFYYTPPQIPIVTTDEILNESLLQGFTTEFSIINIGTSPVSLCGFILSTAANPTVLSGTVIQYGPGAVGTFQARFNGKLAPDVTYYVRAFAINEVGIGYGNDLTLMIPTTVPVITNIEVTNTSEDGFSIKFSIDDLGALSANVGFVFGKTANPRIGGAGIINQTIGTVITPQNITFDYVGDISVAEPYYLSGYGINNAGEGYGTDLTFTLPEMFFWQFVGTPRHARLTHKDEDDHPQYAKESDLASVTNDYSGADMIGVTPITGVTGGTVQEVLESIKALIGAAETGLEASFEDVDPWVITHNLQRLIDLTIWERTADAVGFGVQEFGTSLFGGVEEIHTVASPGVVTVTQQGLNETILTWGTNKSGKVVYR